jgi:hypothetical protein
MSEQRQDNPNPAPGGPQRGDWWESRREWRKEWRGSDPFRGLFPALVLILLGVTLFLATRGTLPWDTWWQYFLVGLGAIFLLDGLVHYIWGHGGTGRFIPGIILVLVGLAFVIGFSEWWPLILVGVGVAILLGMLFRRR